MVDQCRQQERAQRDGALSTDERTLHLVDVGDGTIVVCMFRPGLRAFIADVFQHFDVGVWSAGGKLYVDAICRVLFPPTSKHRPMFQLCWDDVQADYQHSYTKPLTLLTQRFPALQLHQLILVDNRRENGVHFPTQFVLATDYLPKPWDWHNAQADADDWLSAVAVQSIHTRVKDVRSSYALSRHHNTHYRHHYNAHRHMHMQAHTITGGILHHNQTHHAHPHAHSLLFTHRTAKRRVNLLSFADEFDVDDDRRIRSRNSSTKPSATTMRSRYWRTQKPNAKTTISTVITTMLS